MSEVWEKTFELISDLLKIGIVVVIIIGILNYSSAYIAGYATMRSAEQSGRLEKEIFYDYMEKLSIDQSTIQLEESKPKWSQSVQGLGDAITLKYKQVYTVNVFRKELTFSMNYRFEGIAQGFYGNGYN